MPPPYKRRRIPRNNDPDAEFHERRARNDLRLKSVFEIIFEKYSRDFSGIGDEINLQTGEIVVDRGHVHGMRNETDPGCEKDLFDELDSDDDTEHLDHQCKADLLGLDPQLSRIEADVNAVKGFHGEHKGYTLRSGPRRAENGVRGRVEISKLPWKSRLQSRPSAVKNPHQRSLNLPLDDGQAVEPAWRAPPLPSQVPSVQEAASASLFNPQRKQHERSASLSSASLWAPKTSKGYSQRFERSKRRHSSTRCPKSPTLLEHSTVGKKSLKANLSSRNHERSRVSVRSKPEHMIEGLVSSTIPVSPVALEPTGTAAWAVEEDELLRSLKSTRTPYSKIVDYYPDRTEADLEDRWFELHGLTGKLPSLEPGTLDQRSTTSHNIDCTTIRISSLPTPESHTLDDDHSSADLPGFQERALSDCAKSDICDYPNFRSEQQSDKGQPISRKSHRLKSKQPQNSSNPPETCVVLVEIPKATGEKPVDYQRDPSIQQDQPQVTSKLTKPPCKNCFTQSSNTWHGKGQSRICSACYFYARRNHKDRPPSLELKRPQRKSKRCSYGHMPVRRRNDIFHEAKAPDSSPSINVIKSQTRSKMTFKHQTEDKEEITGPAKPVTVPPRILPPDDLSDDELSMAVQTVGTTATRLNKPTKPSSLALHRQTFPT
ncbi:hypothetical protein MMC07_007114 [Pseudocyphellaria aurata]|nr:hypothetical protein [Pseudocyphellaria aurata]